MATHHHPSDTGLNAPDVQREFAKAVAGPRTPPETPAPERHLTPGGSLETDVKSLVGAEKDRGTTSVGKTDVPFREKMKLKETFRKAAERGLRVEFNKAAENRGIDI